METFNQRVSKYFTIVLLVIAIASLLVWLPNWQRGLAAFTAVLIVACPCALALSTPFTMSAALSIFDKNLFYLKNTAVVEQLAGINTIVFDKTGTITAPADSHVGLNGYLTDHQKQLIYSVCSNSNHPLSRMICHYLGNLEKLPVVNYREVAGMGITASVGSHEVKIGGGRLLFHKHNDEADATKVLLMVDGVYLGYFTFRQHYRNGLKRIAQLGTDYKLFLLSGDSNHEKDELLSVFKLPERMNFNQSPQDKLDFIRLLQQMNARVMMVGDGLNDAGALKQSDLGIAVTDNVNNFSPGCDAILDGRAFDKLPQFLRFAKNTVSIIHVSFLISLTYNLIGLSYAITGLLSPLTAAVLMPLSTATIISFTSIATHIAAKKRNLL